MPDARRGCGPAGKTVAGTFKISGHAQKRAAVLDLLAFRCAVLMHNSRRSHLTTGLVPVLREALIQSRGSKKRASSEKNFLLDCRDGAVHGGRSERQGSSER